MAELAFSTSDLAQMRFAVSPMWEVVTSFRLLSTRGWDLPRPGAADSPAKHPVHRRWIEQVRPRMMAAGLDRGWLAELIPPSGYLPDFFNPAPAGPAPTLEVELADILAASDEQVRKDLDHLKNHQDGSAPRLKTLYADPEACLPRVAEEIKTYWELALAPYWARIRVVLDADVFHRARQVAEYGAARLFSDLHNSVSWDDNALRRKTAGAGLVLIPSAFAGPGVFTRVRKPQPPQLAYPARGVGSLWDTRTVTATSAIAAVLGRSRTLLLTELDAPASTSELAQRTGISAAGVSQHLTALRDAGLASAHRTGRAVLYARTAPAELLRARACA
jgi:DNA-binding transcriptional ArsR family regulator